MIAKLSMLLGVIGSFAAAVEPVTLSDQDLFGWFVRLILAGLIGLGGWVLRDAAKTLKETHTKLASVEARLASHDVMFEHWLDDLVERGDDQEAMQNPGRRKSDKVLLQLIEARNQGDEGRRR